MDDAYPAWVSCRKALSASGKDLGDAAADAMMTANGASSTGFYGAIEAAQGTMNASLSDDTTPQQMDIQQSMFDYAIAEATNTQTDRIAAADSGLMKADAAATVTLKTAYADSSQDSAKASAEAQKSYSDTASAAQGEFVSDAYPAWVSCRKALSASGKTLVNSISTAEAVRVKAVTAASRATTMSLTPKQDAYADAIRDGGVNQLSAVAEWTAKRDSAWRNTVMTNLNALDPSAFGISEVASAAMTAMKPGFWESMIPIWGSIRGIEDNIANSEYKTSWGLAMLTANVAFLGMDVCMVGGLARGVGSLGANVAKGLLRDGAEQIAKDAIEVGVRDAVEAGAKGLGESGVKELGEVAGREMRLVGEEIGATLGKGGEAERILGCVDNIGCFTGDTEVVVGVDAQGNYLTKPIADIQVGDTILTRDENNPDAPDQSSQVVQTFSYQTDHLRNITVQDSDGNVQTITTTDFHRFFVEGQGWVEALNLQPGQEVTGPDGQALTITNNEYVPLSQPVTVYNLGVANGHTYFVAEGDGVVGASDAVWVHNTCPFRLEEGQGLIGLIKNGEVLIERDIMKDGGHRALAQRVFGSTGSLPAGVEAYTVYKSAGKVLISGSGAYGGVSDTVRVLLGRLYI